MGFKAPVKGPRKGSDPKSEALEMLGEGRRGAQSPPGGGQRPIAALGSDTTQGPHGTAFVRPSK